jgi:hypothetical protein
MQAKISIVLTGTIVPNSVLTAHADAQIRKNEYLRAINFYTKFGRVYFLENSTYPVESDPEFTSIDNLQIRKMPVSLCYDKGKGYQEFEMLDRWLDEERDIPSRWFKISGRYIFKNFDAMIKDCWNDGRCDLAIDRMSYYGIAFTDIFAISTECYLKYFKGLYTRCDDLSGACIEKVAFQRLAEQDSKSFRIFGIVPKISAISGSSAELKDDSEIIYYLKSMLRFVNILFNRHYLLHPRIQAR